MKLTRSSTAQRGLWVILNHMPAVIVIFCGKKNNMHKNRVQFNACQSTNMVAIFSFSCIDTAAGKSRGSPFDGSDLCATAYCYHGDVVNIRTFIMILTEQ